MMDLTNKKLERDGYIAITDLLTEQDVAWYLESYDAILSGKIDAGQWRSDLGFGQSQKREAVENITQVMWPSESIPDLLNSSAYQRGLGTARQLLGDDMAFDFDMLIDKAPGTDTPTPFHQDMAYWLDLPDRRAVSCWIALDEATVDNGCMWFAPGSYRLPLREHRWHGKSGGALECDGSEAECVCVTLKPGSYDREVVGIERCEAWNLPFHDVLRPANRSRERAVAGSPVLRQPGCRRPTFAS